MTSTRAADTNSWQVTVARAAHPSQRDVPLLGPDDLLVEIATGIGLVTVPGEMRGASHVLERELVLSTPAYDVWVMSWPAGVTAELHDHDRPVAFHVVSGALVEERYLGAELIRHERNSGSTVLVPSATPHRIISTAPTTTVHVHAKDPAPETGS